MKRLISLLFALLLLFALCATGFAADFLNPPLIDEAGYLSSAERAALSAKLEDVRQDYSVDVAIVTETEMYGDDAMSTADDYYDYGFYMDGTSYGAGDDFDGILLYICADAREYWITTHGYGLYAFTDNGIRYLKENIEPYLADDDYYGAMTAFADCAEELLQMAKDGEPYGEDSGSPGLIVAIAVLLPLLIAYIAMQSQLKKMKTAVANDYAANYEKQGSKRLSLSRDIFLYSNIIRTEKPKSNSTSSHRSSSGRSHGGGGGSF